MKKLKYVMRMSAELNGTSESWSYNQSAEMPTLHLFKATEKGPSEAFVFSTGRWNQHRVKRLTFGALLLVFLRPRFLFALVTQHPLNKHPRKCAGRFLQRSPDNTNCYIQLIFGLFLCPIEEHKYRKSRVVVKCGAGGKPKWLYEAKISCISL